MEAMERLCTRWYERKAREANAASGKYAPKWTGADLRRLATGLVGAALARAQEKCGVEIIAVIVMSNHIHLVIRTPRKNCAEFMRIFKSNVARAVNRMTGRRGPLWARRADIQPALDETAAAERTASNRRFPRRSSVSSNTDVTANKMMVRRRPGEYSAMPTQMSPPRDISPRIASMFSSARPDPMATENRGSSAIRIGMPVS